MNMIRTATIQFALIVTLATCGCSNKYKDITVETQANPKVNFGGYDTYAWSLEAAVVRDPDQEWVPTDLDIAGEIRFLVNRELRGKGMTEVFKSPDVLVMYALGVDMKALDVVDDPNEDEVQFEKIPKGGLVLLFADPESHNVMWVGSAVANLMDKPTPELAKKRLNYAVKKMFKKFPN